MTDNRPLFSKQIPFHLTEYFPGFTEEGHVSLKTYSLHLDNNDLLSKKPQGGHVTGVFERVFFYPKKKPVRCGHRWTLPPENPVRGAAR